MYLFHVAYRLIFAFFSAIVIVDLSIIFFLIDPLLSLELSCSLEFIVRSFGAIKGRRNEFGFEDDPLKKTIHVGI
jgi:hypothetical protein